MLNTSLTDVGSSIATTALDDDHTDLARLVRAIHGRTSQYGAEQIIAAVVEPVTAWIPDASEVRYLDVTAQPQDRRLWINGAIRVVTTKLFVTATFATSSNVEQGPRVDVRVRRRADVRSAHLSEVSSRDTYRPSTSWPSDGELVLSGAEGLHFVLPFTPLRGADLWKLLPDLLPA